MKTKLIPCKTCGAMIARSASKCPQCGAAKSTAARALAILAGALALAVLVWAMWMKPMTERSDGLDDAERKIRAGASAD